MGSLFGFPFVGRYFLLQNKILNIFTQDANYTSCSVGIYHLMLPCVWAIIHLLRARLRKPDKTATYAASADQCDWNRVNKGLNLLAVVPFDGLGCLTLSPLLPLPVIAPNMVQSAEDNNAEQRCGYDEQNWRTKLIRDLILHFLKC